MMREIKTRLLDLLQSRLAFVERVHTTTLVAGKPLCTVKGTFDRSVDYDYAWMYALGANSEVVFDVGSNMGQSSLLFLLPCAVTEIFLVEPNPCALSIAVENLILNGFSEKVRLVSAFASNKSGETMEFYTVGAGAAGSAFADHATTAAALRSVSLVSTVTLDAISENGERVPDLIKIDVEGSEVQVLLGMNRIASHGRTKVIVEMHSTQSLAMSDNASVEQRDSVLPK